MAEGWARHLGAGVVEALSAGTTPKGLDPRAVRAMAESGIDISGQASKAVGALAGEAFDLVVTVCDSAAESCPVFSGPAERLHRSFDDPPRLALSATSDDEAMGLYRRVRDQIRDFVTELVDRCRPRG